MAERTLDWGPRFDPRSLDYPIRAALPTAVEDRPKQWRPPKFVLDQGREGACVGFGWTHELVGSPRPDPYVGQEKATGYARAIYRRAQKIDQWEGEDYEGTSVLAGAKAVRSEGLIHTFRWAFSIEDVRDTVIEYGPVVVGVPWYEGMYQTRPSGLVEVSGRLVGGHCLVVYGYHPGMRIAGEDWHARYRVFRWRNSWGPGYGKGGNGLIRYEDLRSLLFRGEACVPEGRNLTRL